MKRVKLIALDMDGTLLASDHATIPQENVEAIRRAHAAGIRVAICTGRMLEDASDFIHRLDMPCMIIAGNGSCASDGPLPEGKIILRRQLTPQDCHRALDILLPSGLAVNGFEDGLVTMCHTDEHWTYHLVARGLIDYTRGEAAMRAAADRGILKLFAVAINCDEKEKIRRVQAVRQAIAEALPHLEVSASSWDNVEIVPGGGKGEALRRVAEYYGLTDENVMAVGDAGNDLSMLRYAFHSVAMGNASEEVKRVCRYQTGTNDECGVAQIIDRVLESKRV